MEIVTLILKVMVYGFCGGFAVAFGLWAGVQMAFECFGPLNIGVTHKTYHYHRNALPEIPEPTL